MSGERPTQEVVRLMEVLGDLPPMPAVATKILKVAGSEYASVAEVTRLIATDQGLATKVLGTCNSAYYALPHRVKTLSRAVALLGFKIVRNLVLVHSLPWKRSASPTFAEKMIWMHAATAALAARAIASQTGRADPEEALLGGLMHDSGRLVLNLLLPGRFEPVMRVIYNRERDSREAEREAFGTDHCEVGEVALRKWSFPDELLNVARCHHDAPETLDALTLVTRGADEIAWLMGQGVKAPERPPEEGPPALACLGYGHADLETLEERVRQSMEQSRDIFDLS
jgi:HD-like signal output (HDOD) protein